jgi:hypothetical protein
MEMLCQLSYLSKKRPDVLNGSLERAMGIEPTHPAWKAGVLPLNYARQYTAPANPKKEGFTGHIVPQSGPDAQHFIGPI